MPSRARSTVLSSWLVLATLLVAGGAAAQTKAWTLTADFDTGTLNNTSDTRVPDAVVLGPTPVSQTHNVWIDNYDYGFIVRVDSLTGKQTSRFDSVLSNINGVSTGLRPANEFCDWSSTGNCPGRVAVDTNGDVWIVNRAFGSQGSVTKFSGNIAHCIDRNNDGKIQTSSDVNGDGIIDMSATGAAQEYFGQNDECILTTIPVGAVNAIPRGVAVDKWGKIWVSTYNEGKLYRYNPNDPVTLEATVSIGANPYSLATGGDYLFASVNGSGRTTRVHITNLTQSTVPCPNTYGVVADPAGNVAYLGSNPAGTVGMYRADFGAGTCTFVSNANHGNTTAMTLDLQPSGPFVWSADYGGNSVSRYTMAGTYLNTVAVPTANPHGMSVDFQGNLWVVSDSAGSAGAYKMLTKINPATNAVIGSYSIGYLAADAAKYNSDATPYLYSDFTGVQIDRQAPYTYVGSWDGVYDGGVPGIPWSKVSWNALIPNTYTTLVASARAADTVAALGTAAYAVVTSGAALSNIKGRYIQVRFDLKGPGWSTVQLNDVTVNGPCGTLGQACCVKDADCGDGNLCTTDTCPVPGGACAHAPIANCCNTNADCDDANACTSDSCPGAGQQCTHPVIAGCCNSNADCDDANLCTTDICSGQGGTCLHPVINGCCNTTLDCTKGNKCSAATCPVPGQFCQGGPIAGCCNTDADCADTDLCTSDVCDTTTNTCSNTKVAGCCNQDTDCADLDACTSDTCSGPGGTCSHKLTPGCCSPSDPKVGTDCDVPVSPHDQLPCKSGVWACAGGNFVCQGSVKPSLDICDGIDNDCDGLVDTPNPCPTGQACVSGGCVKPCSPGEFPCPQGGVCVGGYCVPDGDGGVGGSTSSSSSGGTSSGGTSSSSSGGTGGHGGAGTGGSGGSGGHDGTGASTSTKTSSGSNAKGTCGCEVVGDGDDRDASRLAFAAAALALALGRRSRKRAAR
jgi:streptogramin lyase